MINRKVDFNCFSLLNTSHRMINGRRSARRSSRLPTKPSVLWSRLSWLSCPSDSSYRGRWPQERLASRTTRLWPTSLCHRYKGQNGLSVKYWRKEVTAPLRLRFTCALCWQHWSTDFTVGNCSISETQHWWLPPPLTGLLPVWGWDQRLQGSASSHHADHRHVWENKMLQRGEPRASEDAVCARCLQTAQEARPVSGRQHLCTPLLVRTQHWKEWRGGGGCDHKEEKYI